MTRLLRLEMESDIARGRLRKVAGDALDSRRAFRSLFKILYHEGGDLRHGAASALGLLTEMEPRMARTIQERLMWAMNDESGTYCNGAAAAMAEVSLVQPDLVRGFVPVLLSHLDDVEEEHIIQVLRAIARLASTFPAEVAFTRPEVDNLTRHPDVEVRAEASRTLETMKD